MRLPNTVAEGSNTAESPAYRAARILARSYVMLLVCISLVAAISSISGIEVQLVGSEMAASDSMVEPSRGAIVLSGNEIPFAGLPALWLSEDQQWFTAWVIVTMIASMLSMPGPLKALLGSNRSRTDSEDAADRPVVNRILVAVSAWPLILLLVVTLPLA